MKQILTILFTLIWISSCTGKLTITNPIAATVSSPTINTPTSSPYTSSDSVLTLSGACDSGDTVYLVGDSAQNITCSDSTYSFTVSKSVDFSYSFAIYQKDLIGNLSPSVSMTWIRNTSTLPPMPTLTSPASAFYATNGNSVTVTVGCVTGFTVAYTGDAIGAGTCSSSAFTFHIAKVIDGFYGVSISQTNPSSNLTSPSLVFIWDRKSSLSTPIILSPASTPYFSADPTLAISGSCESSATVSLAGADTASQTCSNSVFSFTVTHAGNGDYVYTVSQQDVAGNSASAPASFTWSKRNLTLTPGSVTLVTGDTQSFTAGGGSGSGYVYSISTNNSGGTIDSSTGLYTAGATALVSDTISVTDSRGVVTQTSTAIVRTILAADLMFTAGTDAQYTFDNTKIELVGGVCRLKNSGTTYTDQNNNPIGFGGALSSVGVVWDAGTNRMKLGNAGGCDATSTNCAELDASWAPHWADLVGYWKMNEGAAGSVPTMSYTNGQVGQALKLNGSDYVSTSYAGVLGSNPRTISSWFKTTYTGDRHEVLDYGDGSGAQGGRIAIPIGTGWPCFAPYIGIDTAASMIAYNASVADGNWHHLVVVIPSTGSPTTADTLIYVDGVQLTSVCGTYIETAPINTLSGDTVHIGSDPAGAGGFHGSLDEVGFWNVALNSTDIQTIYNAGVAGNAMTGASPHYANLTGYWKLDGTLGGVANGSTAGATVGLDGTTSTGTADFADASGNGSVASAGGGTSLGLTGKLNSAIQTDGSSGYVSVLNSDSLSPWSGTGQISICTWVKPGASSSFDGTGRAAIVAKGTAGNYEYALYYRNTGVASLETYPLDGSVNHSTAIGGSLPMGVWSHLCGTYEEGVASAVYINGIQVDRTTSFDGSTMATGSSAVYIGSRPDGASYFDGAIDEVSIWSHALSSTEVKTIYDRQAMSMGARYLGYFDSRVFDAGSSSPWSFLNWTTDLPYFKELPSSGVSESTTAYSSLANSTLMNGNVGLWHLNETSSGTAPAGADFKDSSPSGYNATAVNSPNFGVGGILGASLHLDGTSQYANAGNVLAFDGTDSMSISVWVRPDDVTGWRDIVGHTNSSLQGWYLQKGDGGLGICFGMSNILNAVDMAACTATGQLHQGMWTHIGLTYDGSGAAAGVTIYVDGSPQPIVYTRDTLSGSIVQSDEELWIGANHYTGGTDFFPGSIDELAIWSRTLDPSEISQLYLRGANRIKYQVRSCTTAGCADDPSWLGPDGTNLSYFSELNSNSSPLDGLGTVSSNLPNLFFSIFSSLTVSDNRYFQYRTIFETDDTSSANGPSLKSVSTGNAIFDSSTPTIVNNTPIAFDSLSSYVETLGGNGCSGTPHYELSLDNATWYYWTGAAWGVSNATYAQANTASDINANASTFKTQVGSGNLYVKAFLKSDGTSPCEIDNLSVTGFQ